MTDLLGCPFCGDPMVEGNEYYGHPKGSKCFLAFYCIPFGGDVSAWNTRPRLQSTEASAHSPDEVERLTPEEAWQDLVEKDDRTSPEEYPEMCLITRAELTDYMNRAALQHPAKEMGE